MRQFAACYDSETDIHFIIAKDDYEQAWFVLMKTNSNDGDEATAVAEGLNLREVRNNETQG